MEDGVQAETFNGRAVNEAVKWLAVVNPSRKNRAASVAFLR